MEAKTENEDGGVNEKIDPFDTSDRWRYFTSAHEYRTPRMYGVIISSPPEEEPDRRPLWKYMVVVGLLLAAIAVFPPLSIMIFAVSAFAWALSWIIYGIAIWWGDY